MLNHEAITRSFIVQQNTERDLLNPRYAHGESDLVELSPYAGGSDDNRDDLALGRLDTSKKTRKAGTKRATAMSPSTLAHQRPRSLLLGYAPQGEAFDDARWDLAFAHDVLEHQFHDDDGSIPFELRAQGIAWRLRRCSLALELGNALTSWLADRGVAVTIPSDVRAWMSNKDIQQALRSFVIPDCSRPLELPAKHELLSEPRTVDLFSMLPPAQVLNILGHIQWGIDESHTRFGPLSIEEARGAWGLLRHFALRTGYDETPERFFLKGKRNSFGWEEGTRIDVTVPLVSRSPVELTITLPAGQQVTISGSYPPLDYPELFNEQEQHVFGINAEGRVTEGCIYRSTADYLMTYRIEGNPLAMGWVIRLMHDRGMRFILADGTPALYNPEPLPGRTKRGGKKKAASSAGANGSR